jgi:ActR/RegA family two-component response regulator
LLTFSRRDSSRGPVEVNHLIDDTVGLVERDLALSRVVINRDFDSGAPFTTGNAPKLKQALMNVILNARDAMPNGGTVTLTTRQDRDSVYITCEDTGYGVTERDLSLIFDTRVTLLHHLTGHDLVETAVEAMRLGANDYVMKPFVLRDMLVTVDHAIQSRASEANVIATDIDLDDAPLTIAIGTPLEDDSPADVDRGELGRIAEDIMTIQDHLATVLSRVDALRRPRLRAMASLSSRWRPDGDAA